ncbi:MAG: hypothetical protein DRP90_00145 [Planctomycetota bacterium]|nr:MAG: hypothetical protein DRP90_00145 [Planctomycetota bacterium]
MKRPEDMKRQIFFLLLFAAAAFFLASAGRAETAGKAAKSKPAGKTDMAKAIIEAQRFDYEPNPRDIFADIFVHVTPKPIPSWIPTPTPSGGATAPPTEEDPLVALRNAAAAEAASLRPVLLRKLREGRYDYVITAVQKYLEKYNSLGEELQEIAKPVAPLADVAAKKKEQVARFNEICDQIKVLSILISDSNKSVILNDGLFVREGGNIASIFGDNPDVPADLTVVSITPRGIVVGSKELNMTRAVPINPKKRDEGNLEKK